MAPNFTRPAIDEVDHRQAIFLLEGWCTPLRAGDGLHLALAVAHGATVYTLDRGDGGGGQNAGHSGDFAVTAAFSDVNQLLLNG